MPGQRSRKGPAGLGGGKNGMELVSQMGQELESSLGGLRKLSCESWLCSLGTVHRLHEGYELFTPGGAECQEGGYTRGQGEKWPGLEGRSELGNRRD